MIKNRKTYSLPRFEDFTVFTRSTIFDHSPSVRHFSISASCFDCLDFALDAILEIVDSLKFLLIKYFLKTILSKLNWHSINYLF